MAKRKRTAGDMQHNREESIFDLAVVGAGASGCMAAYAAAQDGAQILLLDANDKIGRKLHRGRRPHRLFCALFREGSDPVLGVQRDLSS